MAHRFEVRYNKYAPPPFRGSICGGVAAQTRPPCRGTARWCLAGVSMPLAALLELRRPPPATLRPVTWPARLARSPRGGAA